MKKDKNDEYLQSKYPVEKLNKLPKIELRDYQKDLVNQVYDKFKNGEKRVFLQSQCGSGKTAMMSEIVKKFTDNGYEVLTIAHRTEIIRQIEERFFSQDVNMSKVVVHMVQTVKNRLDKIKKPKIVIVDEAHHSMAKTYLDILENFDDDTFYFLTSATPYRCDGKGFTSLIPEKNLILGPTTKWLINEGYLSDYDYYQPKIINSDLLKFSKRSGDFTQQSIKKSSETIDPYKVVEYYKKLGNNQQGLVYAATIESSKKIVEAFNECGIKAYHLDGVSDKQEREEIIQKYRKGKIKILSNVELFTEGLDLPNAYVAMIARPTMSLSLYLQFAMRVLRPAENKKAIIIDFVGNAERLGLPDSDFKWTLRPHDVGENKENGLFCCPHCFQIYNKSELEGRFEVEEARTVIDKNTNKEIKLPKKMVLKLYCPIDNCKKLIRKEVVKSEELVNDNKEKNKEIENILQDVKNVENKEEFERFWKSNKKISSADSLDSSFDVAFIQKEYNSHVNFKDSDFKNELILIKKVINIYLRNILNIEFSKEELENSVEIIKKYIDDFNLDILTEMIETCRKEIKDEKLLEMNITFKNPLLLNVKIAKVKSRFFTETETKFGNFLFEPLYKENKMKYFDLPDELKKLNLFDETTEKYYNKLLKESNQKIQTYKEYYYQLKDVRLSKYYNGNKSIDLIFMKNNNISTLKEIKLFCSKNNHEELIKSAKTNLKNLIFGDKDISQKEKSMIYNRPIDDNLINYIKSSVNKYDFFTFSRNYYTNQEVIKKITV